MCSMPKNSTRSFQAKKWVAVLKPFVMITTFMILAAVVLIGMDALGSGSPPVDWSRLLYVGGALTLFAVYAYRSRNRSTSGEKNHQTGARGVEEEPEEDPGEKLDDVRRRIRRRKTSKLS